MSRRTLHTIAVINAAIARFFVQIEVGQVVVKVALTRTQVATQQSSMSREDSRHIKTSHATQNQADAGHPLVKMGNYILGLVAELMQKLANKPGDTKAE
jgi:hypothetical protein